MGRAFLNYNIMEITIIKEHSHYPKGDVKVSEERANYLILMGVAKEKKKPAPVQAKKPTK